jgi:hypothetical protein
MRLPVALWVFVDVVGCEVRASVVKDGLIVYFDDSTSNERCNSDTVSEQRGT